jgi:hypothetical protein
MSWLSSHFQAGRRCDLPSDKVLSRRTGIRKEHSTRLFVATQCHPLHNALERDQFAVACSHIIGRQVHLIAFGSQVGMQFTRNSTFEQLSLDSEGTAISPRHEGFDHLRDCLQKASSLGKLYDGPPVSSSKHRVRRKSSCRLPRFIYSSASSIAGSN